MKGVKGFLIDLDGVLYIGGTALPGAVETLRHISDQGYPFRCVSNTTRTCRASIAARLKKMGFTIPEAYIFTPALAAVAYMKRSGLRCCSLLTTGDVYRDFEDLISHSSDSCPDCIVIGDAGDDFTYGRINAAFRHILMDGAVLIALEKDRYWMASEGLSLSAGPFVTALEFATEKSAVVMGKPSKDFFDLALADMGLDAGQTAMIGDDVITDICGAQSAGIKGILVKTGKYREDAIRNASDTPNLIIDSITCLKEIF